MYVTQIYKYIFITNIRHRCSSSLPGGNKIINEMRVIV